MGILTDHKSIQLTNQCIKRRFKRYAFNKKISRLGLRNPPKIQNLCLSPESFFKWASFSLFSYFQIQLTVHVQYKFLPMTGFKPWTSGIRSAHSTNWATTTAPPESLTHCKEYKLERERSRKQRVQIQKWIRSKRTELRVQSIKTIKKTFETWD